MAVAAISTIGELKQHVGQILNGIAASCRECSYPDCQGYPWILPREEPELLAAGLQLVQLNGADGPIYLDTFARTEEGGLIFGTAGARCPYRGPDGACTVHEDRPLTCHLYPLSLEIVAGQPVWAIHNDCEFVQRQQRAGLLDELLARCQELVGQISPQLQTELATTLARAAAVSRPVEMDCYTVLGPVTVQEC